ncbi:lasso peptide biosynthesis B2 protein [Streptomyces sp. 4F14]|uniref:lasso peptide biosynthesis B2 protein n=1 Tax=Streptomyces sp. 4F14 TaxID=3394380 RepID=UPI003A87F36B
MGNHRRARGPAAPGRRPGPVACGSGPRRSRHLGGLGSRTSRQARYAVCAVRRASRLVPLRWACLEQSTAAAVLLAMAGRRAEWRHGVATDPVRLLRGSPMRTANPSKNRTTPRSTPPPAHPTDPAP